MNKAQLIEVIGQKANISKVQAELAIDTLTRTIIETIKKGEEVTITGFGSFSAKQRKGRTGVNPRNPAEKIEIAPVLVAKFKAGKVLKETLKGRAAANETPVPTETPALVKTPPAPAETPAPTERPVTKAGA